MQGKYEPQAVVYQRHHLEQPQAHAPLEVVPVEGDLLGTQNPGCRTINLRVQAGPNRQVD